MIYVELSVLDVHLSQSCYEDIIIFCCTLTCASSEEDVLATQHCTEDSGLFFIQLTGWQRQDGLLTWVGLHLE